MNVVITGASAGIGRALAATFAKNGHAVLAVARREQPLRSLSQELMERYQAKIHCLSLDLTSPNAPQILFEEAIRDFGKVHVLINNAGMSPYQKFIELNPGHLHQLLALNIQALTDLCCLFLSHMLAHGEPAHLVNVGSVGGYAPLPRFSVYTGSKHYVRALTNMLWQETRGTNVRVSALHPGGTLTEFQVLCGQRLKPSARKGTMTAEEVAEIAYPAILRGKRVIIPGTLNQVAALMGKLLPFPWSMRVMEMIYDSNIEPVAPTYSV